MNSTANPPFNRVAVWWCVWASLLAGVIALYLVNDHPAPVASSLPADSPLWLAALAPFVLSTLVRWVVLPRAPSARVACILFMFGIALAEATCVLGIKVFPANKLELFVPGVLGIVQYVPVFVRRYNWPG